MNTKKATKRALLTSVMALVMCVVMLVGTTFAWFTDTASTGVNKIQAGNLKVDIIGAGSENHVSMLSFTKAGVTDAEAGAEILWEPGCRYLTEGFRIANKGNLALTWKAQVNKGTTAANEGNFNLLDVIDFYLVTSKDANDMGTALDEFSGSLTAGAKSDVYYIKGVMKTTAGNDYQGLTLNGITITVYATQDTVENDSFNNQYDKDAPYETVKVSNEKELRTALFNAPTDGSGVKIVLQDDITLEMLYAAPNLPSSDVIQDYEVGDTLNRYKKGVHPTEDDPTHWNPLVTDQTDEERAVYGAYYHMGANDERIARLVVKANQDVILDLNGHNLSKAARATHGDWSNTCTDIIANYGKLKVTDSVGTGVVMGHGYNSCNGAVLHNYGGTMIVENVKVDGNAAGMTAGTGQYVIVNDGGATIIDGANVYDTLATVDASLLVNTAGTMTIKGDATLNHPNTKNINVKGGEVFVESATIISNKYAIYAKGGTVTVITSAVHINGTGVMEAAGGTITRK